MKKNKEKLTLHCETGASKSRKRVMRGKLRSKGQAGQGVCICLDSIFYDIVERFLRRIGCKETWTAWEDWHSGIRGGVYMIRNTGENGNAGTTTCLHVRVTLDNRAAGTDGRTMTMPKGGHKMVLPMRTPAPPRGSQLLALQIRMGM